MKLGDLTRRVLGLDALRDPSLDVTVAPAAEPPVVEDYPAAPEDAAELDSATLPTVEAKTVELTVLLLTASDDEPSCQAWRTVLERQGLPFRSLLTGSQPITTELLASSTNHGNFQAIVVATDAVLVDRGADSSGCLSADEISVLQAYQREFGIRQISAYAVPSLSVGLSPDCWGGDVSGSPAELTRAGRLIFGELAGTIPLSPGTYGYRSQPTGGSGFTTLVAGEQGAPIVGTVEHPDGRQEMIVTVASGPFSRHLHLLGPGMLSWATWGSRLGHRDFFLAVQVDDILLGAPVATDAEPVRMTGQDVVATAQWSADSGVRLDFAYNAWGCVSRTADGSTDELTETLLERQSEFNWLNHTFGHLDLDHSSFAEITSEIARNVDWAVAAGLPVAADVLVTGAHTGLENPVLADAARHCGIRWIASDASREPESRRLGSSRTIPRHPVNIPLDITTRLEWVGAPLSEATDQTWHRRADEMMNTEAELILDHLLSNDPRPHYSHQNALVGDRLLLALLTRVLRRYHELVGRPVRQLTMAEAGVELERRRVWRQAWQSGAVRATRDEHGIEFSNGADYPVWAPVAEAGHTSDGDRIDWVSVPPNGLLVV